MSDGSPRCGSATASGVSSSVNPSNPAYIRDIIVDSNKQPIIAGQFMSSMRIGDQLFEGRNVAYAYLLKCKTDGSIKWARQIGKGELFSSVLDVTIDNAENIYVAGRFSNKSELPMNVSKKWVMPLTNWSQTA